MKARTARERQLAESAREAKVREVVDDAHRELAPEALADLLLAARWMLTQPDAQSGIPPGSQRDGVPITRPYARPIESLVHGQAGHTPPLSSPGRQALLAYLEDVAARPRGAAVPEAQAA